MKKLLPLLFAVAAAIVPLTSAEAQSRFVTIGTGGVTGIYYPTGGAICRLVNQGRQDHGIRCSVESSAGSVDNLNALVAGDLDFGVVQSDIQHQAYHGGGAFADTAPNQGLRALFGLYSEPYTVVARADAGVENFQDLKGKRVNVGNPGSGQRSMTDVVVNAFGWALSDFRPASELRPAEQSAALCDNRVDAVIYTVGHPNGSIQEATTSCDAVLVNVTGPEIDKLVADNAYYRHATIPAGMYRGNDNPTTTFGVAATLVTTARIPEDVIYHVVKAVFDNFEEFKRLHPAFAKLTKEEMVTGGLSAPLHEGAVRYFKEAGLL